MSKKKVPRLYFDFAATTPVSPRVLSAMQPYFTERFGNPGSLHFFGQEAMRAVDGARETVAREMGADFREIIFTGSATEANNLALRGTVRAWKAANPHLKPRIIVSAIEHESVFETARALGEEGAEMVVLPVDSRGIVDLKALARALNDSTAIVSVMYVNNEVGAIQPVAEIARIIRDFRERLEVKSEKRVGASRFALSAWPMFHTDAAQALQFFDCSASATGADLITLSAHKIYGPKGVGALYIREKREERREGGGENKKIKKPFTSHFSSLAPSITGGGQEFGMRSGTENVPLIAGFAEAVRALGDTTLYTKRLYGLRNYFWKGVKKTYPKTRVNGSLKENESAPHILNVWVPGFSAEKIIIACDLKGLALSAGSACKSRAATPSSAVKALVGSQKRARESIRFSFGRPTSKKNIDEAHHIFKIILHTLHHAKK